MPRRAHGRKRAAGCSAAVLALLLVGLSAVPPAALAQDPVVRRPAGLLDMLFRRDRGQEAGPRRVDPPTAVPRPQRSRASEPTARPRAARRPAAGAPAQPEPQIVEKAEDAKVVLVVGDFMGGGLAEGLTAAFAENPGIRIVARANGSSGLVRDDFYNWPGEIAAILEAEKPAAAVVMLGANDRQQMAVDGGRHAPRTEAWTAAYEARASALAKAFRDAKIPFVWVGMPSFRFAAMSSDMLAFNDIYRKAADAAGGQFVDIWDGFADENGAFAADGPDINGQPARLRGSDGINLTRSGKRKVAFYVEKPLARILETGRPATPAPGETPTGDDPLAAPGMPAAPVDRTLPVSLADPELDGGAELLGGGAWPRRDPANGIAERLAREEVEAGRTTGRADDFRYRRPETATPAVPSEPSPDRTTAIRR